MRRNYTLEKPTQTQQNDTPKNPNVGVFL